MQYGITAADFILFPLYFIGIMACALLIRRRYYPEGHAWRPYFLPALLCKLIGSTALCLIYQYYYKGGDTLNYYHHARVINTAFNESALKWVNLILGLPAWYDGEYIEYTSNLFWYTVPNNYIVGAFGAVASLLSFNTFLNASLLFAVLSFTGVWALFRCFATQYPGMVKPIAIATLFVPSVFFWGSSMSKDALCIFGLGWIIALTYKLIIQRRARIWELVLLVFAFLTTYTAKAYIVASLAPALVFLIASKFSGNIGRPNSLTAIIVRLFVVALFAGGLYLLSLELEDELRGYTLENFAETSNSFRRNMELQSQTESGSFYSLGTIEPTLAGMLAKAPQAINVTLYRPYLWEANNVLMLISALEALVFLVITLYVLFRVGVWNVLRIVRRDVNVQFFLLYTIIFAFAAGITTFNFGTLSRYKIPCMPTLALTLAVIYYSATPKLTRATRLIRGEWGMKSLKQA